MIMMGHLAMEQPENLILAEHKLQFYFIIYIRYSMSIIEKVFHYEENEISSLNVEMIYGLGVRTLQKHWVMRKLVMQF